MISKADIETLAQRKAVPGSPVLSVYLDVDPSKASNLQRRFEITLKDMLATVERGLDQEQAQAFAADARRVREFVARLDSKAKAVILYCDDSENFFWTREVKAPVRNQARWNETPYLAPLLALLDEYERYGVLLVDKEFARFFTVYIGEIEEHFDAMAPAPVRLVKTSGTDHLLSETRFQHKAAMHVHWHLKHVAETLEKLFDQYGFDRLLLGGPVEPAGELLHLLSKRLRSRVVGRISSPMKATKLEVLEEALRVERQVERQIEKQIVEDLIIGDAHHPSAIGLDPTLYALSEERVWRLIYADGFSPAGGQCSNCGMLFAKTDHACDYCGAAIKPVDDLLERVVERTLEQDGKVEEVEGDAANRLKQVGSIGAVLRY
jgi:peptide chain release factor subunit 1